MTNLFEQPVESEWGPEITEYLRLRGETDRGDEEGNKKMKAVRKTIPDDKWAAYWRHKKLAFFTPQNALLDSIQKYESPSGRFVLETCPYETTKGAWSYTKGTVYVVYGKQRVPLVNVYRNYGSFWHTWVEHPNGREYLFCGEDYQGLTMLDLDEIERYYKANGGGTDDLVDLPGRHDYLPDAAKQGFGWCAVEMYPSPDGTILVANGCYWASPYDLKFYDFSHPEKGLPLPVIDTVSSEERIDGWVDNDTFVFSQEIEVDGLTDREPEEMGLTDDEWDEIYEKDPERLGYKLKVYKWKREEVPIVQEITDTLGAWGENWAALLEDIEAAEEIVKECDQNREKWQGDMKDNANRKRVAKTALEDNKAERKTIREEQGRLWAVRNLIQNGHLEQSRWGFHPCDYEHYRKLKFLNHKLMEARVKHAAFVRYKRKDPDNRVRKHYQRNEKGQKISYTTTPWAQPDTCPVFSKERNLEGSAQTERSADLKEKIVVKSDDVYPWCIWTIDPGVEEDYRRVRFPKEKPSDLEPLKLDEAQVAVLLAQFPDNPWAKDKP